MTKLFGSILVATALALSAAPASAADSRFATKEEAARLKKQGDDALIAGRYADAIKEYDAALALGSNALVHYNRGRALENLKRWSEAVRAYETFVAEAPAEIIATARDLPSHMAELRKHTTLVTLEVSPAGARISNAGALVGNAPLTRAVRLDAGRAEIAIEKEGYASETRRIVLMGGEELTISVSLRKLGEAPPAPARATEPSSTDEQKSSSVFSKWWFWTGAAVVAASAATVVIVVTQKPEETKGSIEPGRISAPLLRF